MIPAIPASWTAVAAAVALATGFGAGWTVNGWRWEAKQAAALQAAIDARVKAEQDANAASAQAEKERERSRKIVRDAERKLYHDREGNPDYRCAVPDYGLQLYNQPRLLADPTGQPDRAVPAP